MRFCDFFAGIGGFRLGLERAGHKGVWACEVDPFCRKIYTQHFEEPQGKDINDVVADDIPEVDLWCGGFPCQDLSVAGKRAGLKAKRSGLYWVWHRLIEARRPPWLLIENVPGLLSSRDGGDFRLLLSSLAGREVLMPRHGRWPDAGLVRASGLEVAWRILDAQYFGLAQRRHRVFIVRHLGGGRAAEILFERESLQRNPRPRRETGSEIAANFEGCANNYGGLRAPITARAINTHGSQNRSDHTKATYIVAGFMAGQGARARSIGYREEQSPTLKSADSGTNRTPTILCPPPNTNGKRKGAGIRGRIHTPDSPRYKVLGNAVAVPVIEWIGRRLPQ